MGTGRRAEMGKGAQLASFAAAGYWYRYFSHPV